MTRTLITAICLFGTLHASAAQAAHHRKSVDADAYVAVSPYTSNSEPHDVRVPQVDDTTATATGGPAGGIY